MTVILAAVIGVLIGAAVGAAATAWWLGRSQTALGEAPAPDPAPPVAMPAAKPEAPVAPPEAEPDDDLKPVFDATRGVVSALEQRYQGARAEGAPEGGAKRAPRPRRRRA